MRSKSTTKENHKEWLENVRKLSFNLLDLKELVNFDDFCDSLRFQCPQCRDKRAVLADVDFVRFVGVSPSELEPQVLILATKTFKFWSDNTTLFCYGYINNIDKVLSEHQHSRVLHTFQRYYLSKIDGLIVDILSDCVDFNLEPVAETKIQPKRRKT